MRMDLGFRLGLRGRREGFAILCKLPNWLWMCAGLVQEFRAEGQ